MSTRTAHLDIIRGDDGWFWRFVASNGRELARSSETYKRRGAAEHSAVVVLDANLTYIEGRLVIVGRFHRCDIRVLDERTAKP